MIKPLFSHEKTNVQLDAIVVSGYRFVLLFQGPARVLQ
jgi:hypothetical protein